jgi:PIN domain nuclease of toxin-antitoxin system
MRLLLDTHVLLWWVTADRKLSAAVRELMSDGENRVFISAATFWEIAIKQTLGRIEIDLRSLRDAIAEDGFEELPVNVEHTLQLSALPLTHRDPFDRLLIAQSIAEMAVLVTRDDAVHAYAGMDRLTLFRA